MNLAVDCTAHRSLGKYSTFAPPYATVSEASHAREANTTSLAENESLRNTELSVRSLSIRVDCVSRHVTEEESSLKDSLRDGSQVNVIRLKTIECIEIARSRRRAIDLSRRVLFLGFKIFDLTNVAPFKRVGSDMEVVLDHLHVAEEEKRNSPAWKNFVPNDGLPSEFVPLALGWFGEFGADFKSFIHRVTSHYIGDQYAQKWRARRILAQLQVKHLNLIGVYLKVVRAEYERIGSARKSNHRLPPLSLTARARGVLGDKISHLARHSETGEMLMAISQGEENTRKSRRQSDIRYEGFHSATRQLSCTCPRPRSTSPSENREVDPRAWGPRNTQQTKENTFFVTFSELPPHRSLSVPAERRGTLVVRARSLDPV